MDLSHWDNVTFLSRDDIAYLLAGVDPLGGPYQPNIEGKATLYKRLVSEAFDNAFRNAHKTVSHLLEPPEVIAPDIFDFIANELPSYELRVSVADVMSDPANASLLRSDNPQYSERFNRDDIHYWISANEISGCYRFDGIANDRLPDLNLPPVDGVDESSGILAEAFNIQLDNLLDTYWDIAESLKIDTDVAKLERIGNWQRIVLLDRREDGESFLSEDDISLLIETGKSGVLGYVLDEQQANREWRAASFSERWVAFGIHIHCRITAGGTTTEEEAFYLFRLASEMVGVLSMGDTGQIGENSVANNARAAADARHSKPGGSREKRRQICAAWASGKYSSRDICAEQECAALGMSFSTARKALIGTPDPNVADASKG